MEYSNEENVLGSVVHSHELNSSSSTVGEIIKSHEVMTENNQSSSNNVLLEINPNNDEQDATVTTQNSFTDVKPEVTDTNQEMITESRHSEVNTSNTVTKQTDLISEGIVSEVQITEKYEEYVSVPEEQSNQASDYINEYMLEEQADNVFIPDGQNESLNSSEDCSKIGTEDNQMNKASDELEQHDALILTRSTHNDINEINLISDNPPEQSDNPVDQLNEENLPEMNQKSRGELYNDVKSASKSSNAENDFDKSDKGNRDEDANVIEVPVEENFSENTTLTENVEDGAKNVDDQSSYVKEECSAIPNEDDSILNDGQERSNNANESIIQEQVICSNDEIVESVDIANATAVSSESMSVEDYTIDEGMEVTEIQEGEYTIVEGPSSLDITTNQLDRPTSSEETWVLLENTENSEDNVVDTESEIYLSELRSEAESRQSVSSQASENKPRRGRKPTYDIPMHVLGHDISKPVESVPNGRALPKPRLGVKVPYRNLTSQIVTKAEIEKEVMDRARLKQEQIKSRADIIFARKLTQRLARKIAPSPDPPRKFPGSKKSKESNVQTSRNEEEIIVNEEREISNEEDNTKIQNDSDLLAILEGEGDEMPVLPKEVPLPQVEDSNLKLLEREIALQQLQDLPHQAPRPRIFRGRQNKLDGKAPQLTPEASVLKTKASDKSTTEKRETVANQNSNITMSKGDEVVTNILSEKENHTTKRPSSKDSSREQNVETVVSPRKQPVDIEPQVKVNMVLKTYSRKRKTIEFPETLGDSPLSKKAMLIENDLQGETSDTSLPTNVYVTKSSRVIKKKVIWDPDETPTRSPKSTIKSDTQASKITPVKSTKLAEKPTNSEKPQSEKSVKEKIGEKKSHEKINHKKNLMSPIEKKIIKNENSKNKTPVKIKKVRSEVDKLLMDEGAVKMLYDLKNNEELVSKKKKSVYSVEKAHKDIMKKANEIKSDLQQNTSNESPKFLRKKDAFTPSPGKPAQISHSGERKMSKDSTRSSVHTPPGSPAYSFSHSQSSMLVRRRSSSSISSTDEANENDVSKISRKKSLTTSTETKSKKSKKNDQNEQLDIATEVQDAFVKSPLVEDKLNIYKTFTITKNSKHVAIELNYENENCYCTAQVLDELTAALQKFAKEKDCHVVSIMSSSKAFCLGLDYASLISDKEDIRKEIATALAERVKEFLLCLLKFPKVLIAGIQGECVGLGVTMLPLFDMVIASDTATFSTSYASLGCVAEAGFLLSPPIFTNHGLAAELLYSTQKITADDAFRRGLVTRLCWPEKYNETFKNIITSISQGSKQSLVATKKHLRRHLVETIEGTINSESKVLVGHWISTECQKNFAQINGNN